METKKERREVAREKAREAREQAAKKKRRNRLFIQGGIGAALVAAAVVMVNITSHGHGLRQSRSSTLLRSHHHNLGILGVSSKLNCPHSSTTASCCPLLEFLSPLCHGVILFLCIIYPMK